MASITATGVGSGLNIEDIVGKLMELERQPLDRVEKKQTQVSAQISAFGALKNKIASFQTAMSGLSSLSSFQVFKSTSSNDSVLTSTVDSGAVAGDYTINVQQLATRDKFAYGPFTDSNTVLGGGTLTLSVGENSFDVNVSDTATLKDIRDAINNSTSNTGVSATLVNGADGTRLVMSANETGTANTVSISVTDNDGNNSDQAGLSALTRVAGGTDFSTSITQAQDALVEVDGFLISSSSNTISNAVDGLSFTVKNTGEANLNVSRDDEQILAAVQTFADAYNALRTEIKNQRAGQLEADSSLLSMERALTSAFNSGEVIDGSKFSYLIEVGLSVDKNGVMQVDEAAVNKAMMDDFSSFVNVFSAEGNGFANRLEGLAKSWLADDGLIDARQDGLNTQLRRLQDDQIRMEARLELVETRIRSQYAAMDALVAQLNSTGDYVKQQLAALAPNKST